MAQFWKLGQQLRPHDADQYDEDPKAGLAVFGYAVGIIGAFCVTAYALYRLFH